MRSKTNGDGPYQDHGRIIIRIKKGDAVALKAMAASNEKTLMETIEDSIEWMSSNLDSIPASVPKTISERSVHLRVKMSHYSKLKSVAIATDQPIRRILEFIATVWARTNGNPK